MNGWGRHALVLGALLAAAPLAARELVQLELLRQPLDGGDVRFNVGKPRSRADLPIDPRGKGVESAETRRYTLYVDLDSIVHAERGGYVRYQLYVEPRSGGGEILEYTAKALPAGRFPPQRANVAFVLSDPAELSGTITLPLFSLEEPRYVEAKEWAEPEKVELPGGASIVVPLKSLAKLNVRVQELGQPERARLWRRAVLRRRGAAPFAPYQLDSGSTGNQLLLDLQPGPRAIFEAMFPRSPKGAQDNVEASVVVALPWEGLPTQTVAISVPVRFVPWPPTLLVPLTLGALLGSLAAMIVLRRQPREWWRALVVSWIAAVLVWGAAMVLVSLDSQFKLFSFELDPFQMLPVALIGATMGLLGFKSLEFYKKILRFGGGGAT